MRIFFNTYGESIPMVYMDMEEKVDNFMDKLAQRFSAQEMIKANSHAEAEEMKRLQLQVSEYEKILQEMRKLNYKNTELSEKIDLLIGENAEKISNMKEDERKLILSLRDLTDEQIRNWEAELARREEERIEREKENQLYARNNIDSVDEILSKRFKSSEEFFHKESVKVYRNVQAVVLDEVKQLKNAMYEENKKQNHKINIVMIISIISLIISVISLFT